MPRKAPTVLALSLEALELPDDQPGRRTPQNAPQGVLVDRRAIGVYEVRQQGGRRSGLAHPRQEDDLPRAIPDVIRKAML
jgi:hypothetical protein